MPDSQISESGAFLQGITGLIFGVCALREGGGYQASCEAGLSGAGDEQCCGRYSCSGRA